MFLVMGAASLPAAVVVARERRKRRVAKRTTLVATVTAGLVAGATIVWLRRPAGGKRLPLPFAVVDTETTGLDATVDRVIEIAVVHADGLGSLTNTFTWRIRPDDGRHGAEHVHHISEADLVDAPTFGEILDEVTGALRGRTLVAHNAPFDIRFLTREYERAGRPAPATLAGPLCTLDLARRLGMAPLRLAEVARALKSPLPATAHRATDDAVATAKLLRPLLNRAGVASARELPLID
ncbi:MAG TPA: 3'-5' exonuclease [Candidatus Microthrix parvicella]|jgi:DNA polymerase III epsilon subunit family exonuclease|uniref:Putative DNA-directed DNA polymerase n=2 Tax=Microthrixaceae TaxID=1798913 RepID=R4Z2A0_9ACTN|nr:putative DNA-directed DNA polymerase [Candidatus Microthrix parvicella RN1]HBX09515.1 3'-5' exonuclease [Candidatus Microthrix parvicella]